MWQTRTEYRERWQNGGSSGKDNTYRWKANKRQRKANKGKILAYVADSIMLYEVDVWGEEGEVRRYREKLEAVQRKAAVRICEAYRIVSTEALQIIVAVVPIKLKVEERRYLFSADGDEEETKWARKRSNKTWQEEWAAGHKEAWTRRLILNLTMWVNRKYGEVNYHLRQMLLGHGCFQNYLHAIGKAKSDACIYSRGGDTAEHSLSEYHKWKIQRRRVRAKTEEITPKNIIEKMVEKKSKLGHHTKICQAHNDNKRRRGKGEAKLPNL